jgi:D,D-heptose 1,7-bisphosphate phosphatase
MPRPAVFFDRDNTLIVSDGYLGDPSGVVLVDGAADAVAKVRALGFAAVVVSNQSGVARGMFDEDSVKAVNIRIDELLRAENGAAVIDRHEFCPYHPEATVEQYRQDSPLRKPKPGMLLTAAETMKLDLARSWVVGDAPRDIAAGKAAGCRTILVRNGKLPPSPAAAEELPAVEPDYAVATIREAARIIERSLIPATPAKFTTSSATPAPAPPPAPTPASAAPPAAENTQPAPAAPAPAITPPPPAATTKPATPPPAARLTAPRPAAAVAPKSAPDSRPTPSQSRLEAVAEQILLEVRRRNEQTVTDFSVSKLLAGIVQVLVLATLFLGYVRGGHNDVRLQTYLLTALVLQTMTIALLIMSRQK